MDLSIVTVTYQSKAFIAGCIGSVLSKTIHIDYEHIIVDNGSTDGTIDLIEKGYKNFVTLIENGENLGFAKANAIGLARAKGKYLLFLNPDMQLYEGELDTLLDWMEKRPFVGIASCKLLNQDKVPHPCLRPMKRPTLLPYASMFLSPSRFFCSVSPHFFYPHFNDDEEQEVEIVRGSFMLMPRKMIEQIGFAFDPKYFILFEDLDICREAEKLGYKVVYTPCISAIDFFGRSFLAKGRPWKYLQMCRSLKIYISKWHSPYHLIWLYILMPVGFLLKFLNYFIRKT